jgi:Na+/proline symporter
VLPPGITGLILAGAFAAAISSLDSVLAALSQTSLALFEKRFGESAADHQRVLWLSKVAVVGWGIALQHSRWPWITCAATSTWLTSRSAW